MSSYLLFCTADVPETTVNKLFSQTERNFFVLFKDPSQTVFDHWGTKPPIESFQTGFLGWDALRLQDYLTTEPPESVSNPETNTCQEQFAVLDERSLRDEIVLLFQLIDSDLTHVPSGDYSDNEDDIEQQWWSWRVRFADAHKLALSLENLESLPTYCSKTFVGEDGVFDVNKAHEAYVTGWEPPDTSA